MALHLGYISLAFTPTPDKRPLRNFPNVLYQKRRGNSVFVSVSASESIAMMLSHVPKDSGKTQNIVTRKKTSCYVCKRSAREHCEVCWKPVCVVHFSAYFDSELKIMMIVCDNCAAKRGPRINFNNNDLISP